MLENLCKFVRQRGGLWAGIAPVRSGGCIFVGFLEIENRRTMGGGWFHERWAMG